MAQEFGSLCQFPSTSSIPFEEKLKKVNDQEDSSSFDSVQSQSLDA